MTLHDGGFDKFGIKHCSKDTGVDMIPFYQAFLRECIPDESNPVTVLTISSPGVADGFSRGRRHFPESVHLISLNPSMLMLYRFISRTTHALFVLSHTSFAHSTLPLSPIAWAPPVTVSEQKLPFSFNLCSL